MIEIPSNQRTAVPQTALGVTHALASDGTVLVQQSSSLGLWKQGETTPIRFPLGLNHVPQALSDDASTLITIGFVVNPTVAVLPKQQP